MLLRQAEFIVSHGRKRCLRHVFLFEELVVFSKTRHSATGHDAYVYKHSIKVDTSLDSLTQSVADSGADWAETRGHQYLEATKIS